MKTTFNTSMFDSIKTALETAKSKSGSNFKNVLSVAKPGTYVVRLLPNIKSPAETFFHFYHHGWNSVSTGQYIGITSPSTYQERDIISELYFKILKNGTKEEQERAKLNLRRKENWYVNVYVVNDPVNPDNNGTVKVLKYGKQINKIIDSAVSGDDADEFGAKIFDLSATGCNFRIKAELVSDNPGAPKYPTYVSSKFLAPSAIDGMTEDKISEIYAGIYDLTTFTEHKTAAEIQEFVDVHYFGAEVEKTSAPVVKAETEEDDVSYEATAAKTTKPVTTTIKTVATADADDKVKAILAGLDDI